MEKTETLKLTKMEYMFNSKKLAPKYIIEIQRYGSQ